MSKRLMVDRLEDDPSVSFSTPALPFQSCVASSESIYLCSCYFRNTFNCAHLTMHPCLLGFRNQRVE